jgi:hypothetical protein
MVFFFIGRTTSDSVVLIGPRVIPSRGVLTVHERVYFNLSFQGRSRGFRRKENSSMTSEATTINADCLWNFGGKNECVKIAVSCWRATYNIAGIGGNTLFKTENRDEFRKPFKDYLDGSKLQIMLFVLSKKMGFAAIITTKQDDLNNYLLFWARLKAYMYVRKKIIMRLMLLVALIARTRF